jgi:hypothetical protein
MCGRSGRADAAAAFETRWREWGSFRQRTFHTRSDADRFAAAVTAGQCRLATTRHISLPVLAEEFLVDAQHRLRPSTVEGYWQSWRNHIAPVFAATGLDAITTGEVQDWGLNSFGLPSPGGRTISDTPASTWLDAGVSPPQVAEWAGHSVQMLLRVYAKCLDGQEEASLSRIEAARR